MLRRTSNLLAAATLRGTCVRLGPKPGTGAPPDEMDLSAFAKGARPSEETAMAAAPPRPVRTVEERHEDDDDGHQHRQGHRDTADADPGGRSRYAKAGYDFIENFRQAGPRGSLGTLQTNLLLYSMTAAAVVLYCVYYLTTYKVKLTTDPSPQRNTMFQRFPSDYVLLESKWTGRRRVVRVEPAPDALRHADGTLPYRERDIHVNTLKDRLIVYQQTTTAAVLVDTAAVLTPDRFMKLCEDGGRASVAVRRTDQLLPDSTATGKTAAPATSATSSSGRGNADGRRKLLVETEMRMRDTKNGLSQGNITAFRETIAHVITDKLLERYYQAILDRAVAGGIKRVYAKELIKNGIVTALGITLRDIMPDIDAFADEVFAVVTSKMGDDVILYKYQLKTY